MQEVSDADDASDIRSLTKKQMMLLHSVFLCGQEAESHEKDEH